MPCTKPPPESRSNLPSPCPHPSFLFPSLPQHCCSGQVFVASYYIIRGPVLGLPWFRLPLVSCALISVSLFALMQVPTSTTPASSDALVATLSSVPVLRGGF